jgi:peroxiredoxin
MELEAGNKAPDFTVNDQDGKPVSLSDSDFFSDQRSFRL